MEKSRYENTIRKCPRCNYIVDKNDTLCIKCGKKLPVKVPAKNHLFIRHFDNL